MQIKRHLILLSLILLILGTASYFPPITRVQIEDVSFTVVVEWQPIGDALYVTDEHGKASMSRLFHSRFGSSVLFMHNNLSGGPLKDVQPGDMVRIHRGTHYIEREVTGVHIFKRLPDRSFISARTGNHMTESEVARLMFQPGHLVLQTCYEKDGDLLWGVIFIQVELD